MSEVDWERIVTEYGAAVEALDETASRARAVVSGQWRMREAITPEFQAEVLRREARFDAARHALHEAMKVKPQ